MLLVDTALGPRRQVCTYNGRVKHEGAVGLQDLEGADVVCLPRELLEGKGVEDLSRHGLVHRDERHALLRDVVHVAKTEHRWFTLSGRH